MAERVTERVQISLFKLYSTAGLAVLGVLGLIGYDILSVIEERTEDAADKFAAEITSLNAQAEEIPAEVTDKIMDGLKEQNKEIIMSTAEIQASARRARNLIKDVETALDSFEPKVESLEENLQKIFNLEVTAKNVEASFPELKSHVANVINIADQITALAWQVDQMKSDLSKNNETTLASPGVSYEQRGESIQSVIVQSAVTINQLSDYAESTTLFVQFAR